MKGRILFILLCFASAQAFGQPAIADTTRVNLFDRGNKWSASLLDVKTYIGASGGSVATDAIFDAKGDLPVGTGANTAAKLTVGTDGQQIFADASQSTGLRWGPVAISPTQITSDQNDYNPTDFSKSRIVRISTDAGIRYITSFVRSSDWDEKTIVNVGSFPIGLPSEHPDGTAANRISGGGVYILLPGNSVRILSDPTTDRWRILDKESDYLAWRGVFYRWSAGSITAADWGDLGLVTSGTAAAVGGNGATTTKPGYANLGTGSTAAGVCGIYFSKTVLDLTYHGKSHLQASWYFDIPTLSTSSERFTTYFELAPLVSATAGGANNTIGVRQVDNVVSGNFEAFVISNAGAVTTLDLGVLPVAAQKYLIRIELNYDFDEALFFIDGVYKGRLNSGFPLAQGYGTRALIQKSVGITGRSLEVFSMYTNAIYPD